MTSQTTGPKFSARTFVSAALLLSGMLLGGTQVAQATEGAVFTTTNSATANSVAMFSRATDGSLSLTGTFFTGGTGTGAGIGNAGAVILSPDHHWLFAINAGSNDISVFSVKRKSLTLVDRVPSGGTTPFSLTLYGNLLYVVNGGTPTNITGFTVSQDGHLTQIPGSTQSLSVATVKPGQIKFSPYGDLLIVTEQTTNDIDVFPVDENGVASPAIVESSLGIQPFGFDFDPSGHLLISEAKHSSASSYFVSTFGILPIAGPIQNRQTAACWLVASPDGRYAWTANTTANNISAYSIAPNGGIRLIPQKGGVAVALASGSHPLDLATDNSGHFYVLNQFLGTVSALNIQPNGTLTPINSAGKITSYGTGLAAY